MMKLPRHGQTHSSRKFIAFRSLMKKKKSFFEWSLSSLLLGVMLLEYLPHSNQGSSHCIFPLFTTKASSALIALHSLFSASLNTTLLGP